MLAQFGHLAVHLMSKVFITNCTMSRIWVVFELVHLNHHPTYISISNMYESQNPDQRLPQHQMYYRRAPKSTYKYDEI